MVDCLTNNLNNLQEKHCPFKEINIKESNYPPWFNKKILDLIEIRNFHYNQYTSTNNVRLRFDYQEKFKKNQK